jgi:hypothetical protein
MYNQKICVCGKDMTNATPLDFIDDLSWTEFNISGLCQDCQDMAFGDEDEEEDDDYYDDEYD